MELSMKLNAKKDLTSFKKGDTAVIFFPESKKTPELPDFLDDARAAISLKGFQGKFSQNLFIPFANESNLIIFGMGKEEDLTAEKLRRLASSVVSEAKNRKISSLNIFCPETVGLTDADILKALAEGLFLSSYSFNKYKSNNKDEVTLTKVTFISKAPKSAAIVSETETLCTNTLLCRDLVNDCTYSSSPQDVAALAKKLAAIDKVTCKVHGKKAIEKMGMGLLSAVNQGSARDPQLVELTYKGNPSSKKSVAIVGKGITFDSGGMNLKTSGHIETMRMDMAGSAAALYAFKSAAELKLKVNLHVLLPLTENMLSNDAYRPGDVFRAYNGKTVEIGNTDAEGRLVLADALAYCTDKLKPEYIIDIATLTGACVMTFGEHIAAVIATDDHLSEQLIAAGNTTAELLWPLPINEDYEENMKSDYADICNMSSEKNSGTIHGAAFLKNFIGDTKWAHIDIAGTAWNSRQRTYRPKNASGYGVRLLTEFLKNLDI
jgi:leucyl aminopeptidase